MSEFKYFTLAEFDCKETGENAMSHGFIELLDELRGRCGFPFVVNSGFRSVQHSEEVGKARPGYHTKGIAADIAVDGGWQRRRIVEEALTMGFKGIGVAKSFVHVDFRNDSPVLWTYDGTKASSTLLRPTQRANDAGKEERDMDAARLVELLTQVQGLLESALPPEALAPDWQYKPINEKTAVIAGWLGLDGIGTKIVKIDGEDFQPYPAQQARTTAGSCVVPTTSAPKPGTRSS